MRHKTMRHKNIIFYPYPAAPNDLEGLYYVLKTIETLTVLGRANLRHKKEFMFRFDLAVHDSNIDHYMLTNIAEVLIIINKINGLEVEEEPEDPTNKYEY